MINMETKNSKFKFFKTKTKQAYEFLKRLFRLNGNFFMPASLTFYFLISFIPLVSIVFMVLSFYSKNSTETVISIINSFTILPEETVESFVSYIKGIDTSDYITLIVSIIASIYVASRGIECFSRFSNTFYGIPDDEVGFFKRKFRSITITFILIILLSACVFIYALFSTVVDKYINYGLSVFLKYLSIAVVLFITILFIFRMAPSKKEKVITVLPGAIICVFSLIICVLVYSIYLNFSLNRMSSIYGPLTSVIILLLMVFVISYIVFASFYLNILLKERNDKKNKIVAPIYDSKHEKVVFIDNKQLKINSINTQINTEQQIEK